MIQIGKSHKIKVINKAKVVLWKDNSGRIKRGGVGEGRRGKKRERASNKYITNRKNLNGNITENATNIKGKRILGTALFNNFENLQD